MPYFHTKDNGDILFWQRRCKVCGKKWPFMSIFAMSPPKDMRFYVKNVELPQVKKGQTNYAKWADKKWVGKVAPGATTFASRLPHWPRWARIMVTVGFVIVPLVVLYLIFGR